ncbi:DUF2790 domain-containing protein [Pseudomonas sp. C1C7]|uniref:DUF2790 domain-containing protein n=1 Tax=Pseudomonas sp. C1C7 TaxID=2735272 RepID=UPI0015867E4E|nr:DUF2790 domain-containing protein [Pseudomonas sp. C1C7]NUT75284.1 DUF2790 domain-containing protein [Pseudomonas sp. C1C7]
MKTLIALFLGVVAGSAVAAPEVEQARSGVALDMAKVISITDISHVCGVVPVELAYEDSNGQRHTVTYQVMGDGCSGG